MTAAGAPLPVEAATAMVEVRNVGKSFDGVRAVDHVSFTLARGRFLTILGPSGSGKTTLLRMIAGFIEPGEGEIFIHGRPVLAVPPHRRSIGMVFQRLALFPHLTAAQNVAYPLRMRGFAASEIPDRVAAMLKVVQLDGLGGRRIHELSGGQQQRVAIARALVYRPDLVLLDEPLAALDRKLREEMQLEFRRIQQELGVTTINVTHDQREALVMSDEVLVMDGGRVQQLASPDAAYGAPANAFVAGFIGVTNFFEAVAVEGGQVRLGGHDCACGAGPAPLPVPGTVLDCALRAEHVRITPAGAASGELRLDVHLAGVVRQVAFEGDRTLYEVSVPALGGALLRAIDRSPESHLRLAAGSPVGVGWRACDLMPFPR